MSSKRKFIVIAKASNAGEFVKYRSNNAENFIKFLTRKYPGACYANFYSNRGTDRGALVLTWGKFKGLQPARSGGITLV